MRMFVKYLIVVALCGAALLNSCIKEEIFKEEVAELSVNLTRAGTSSTVQGDAITDVWIWAFKCDINGTSGAPTLSDDTVAVGGRYVSGLSSYGNISVHLPLPICDGEQDYLLVAVINTQTFTGAQFSADSTWGEIKSATFNDNAKFWSACPSDEGLTPEVMPVSNWTTFTIKSNNTHSSNCYRLNLPVYRAVAKAQFFASRSNSSLDVDILEATVVASKGYSNGKVLTRSVEQSTGSNSEVIQRGIPDATSTSWWWGVPKGAETLVYNMKNSDSGFTAVTDIATTNALTDIVGGQYTKVASTFLYENDFEAATPEGFNYAAQQGDGYNMYVKYSVNGQVKEAYTPLGKVVRNHDYQIKATVDAGGQMNFNVIVNEWLLDEEQIMDYQNTVTVSSDDMLMWRSATPASEGGKTTVKDNGRVETAPVGDFTTTRTDLVDLGSLAGGSASLDFGLRAPVGGKWYAELVTIQGEVGAVVFKENNSTVISGDISTTNRIVLNIKNAKANSATQGGYTDNIVELQISAKKVWGGQERTYKVFGLTGLENNANYQLIQPLGN